MGGLLSGRFGKGLRQKSAPHKVAHRFEATLHPSIAERLAAGIAGSGDLGAFRPSRMDQGPTSTCFAHSAAAVSWAAFAAAGQPLLFVPSPRMLASCTYARERMLQTPVGQPLKLLEDTGAELADVAAVLSEYGGGAPIGAPTSDGRYSDVEAAAEGAAFPEPDFGALTQASTRLVVGEYAISNVNDAGTPRVVAAAIDAKIPVWLGFLCDSAYEDLQPGQVAAAPNRNDPNAGGHAEYIAAYRTNANGQLEFRVENSWGSGWCEGGACWAGESWLRACWELWPFAVQTAAGAS